MTPIVGRLVSDSVTMTSELRSRSTSISPYGTPHNLNKGTGLYNDVFVYDVKTNTFGVADRMPIDNNLPMTVVRGDQIYMLGGETGGGVVEGEFYGHHPDLLLIGKMQAINP